MKFGLCLVHFGPTAAPETLVQSLQVAEDSGCHLAMISDHVILTEDVARGYPAPYYDAFATLSFLAGVNTRLEFGTTVLILPYRNPLLVARMSANLDQLSGGRFILGVGVGWSKLEYAALGVPFHRRGAMADEYLDVITQAWTKDLLSFKGEFVDVTNVQTGPAPVRQPQVPVWVGGTSQQALRRAVRFGAGWHPNWKTVPWLRDTGLPALRRTAEETNGRMPAFTPRIYLNVTDARIEGEERLAGHGTLDQIRGDLEALAELGAEYVVFDTYGPPTLDRSGNAHEQQRRTLGIVADALLGQFR